MIAAADDPSQASIYPASPRRIVSAGTLERRVSLLVVIAGLIVWTVLLAWVPARFQGFDDAKYLGIGLNVLAGRGPTTVFGNFFGPHSPLWPIVIALPQARFGIDAYTWAHVLNIAASSTVVGLAAWLGWRIRPAAGALAVASLLLFPYVFELSRRIGLDMPEAALTLGYLVIAGIAVRRGTLPWAVAMGAIFAIGFLVKESILPVAPVPFLAAIAAGRPGAITARVAAWAGLVVVVLTSWWWWVFAMETGRAYRFGTPAWTLIPLLVVAVMAIAVGLTWPRMVVSVGRLVPRRSARAVGGVGGVGGSRLSWALALAWVLAQTLFFSRTKELREGGLFDSDQMVFYLGRWVDQLRPLLAIGGIGATLDLGARIVRRRRPDPAIDDLWLALLCSAPFLLLVVGVGELPRHYVAQMVLLLVIGSAGWLGLIEAAVRRPTAERTLPLFVAVISAGVVMAPLVSGRPTLVMGLAAIAAALTAALAIAALIIGRRQAPRAVAVRWLRDGGAVVTIVVLAFVTAVGPLAARAADPRASVTDDAKAAAVASVTAWIRAEVPPGSTIAFGRSLPHEMAVELGEDYRIVLVREAGDVLVDPEAPLGVIRQGGSSASDWIALAASSRHPQTLIGYQAGSLIEQLRQTRTDFWVHVDAPDFGEPLVVDAALTKEHGFDRAANWSWPSLSGNLVATIYRVQRDRLAFDPTVWMSAMALRRVVDQLEADGGAGAKAAAEALVERVRLHPDDPAGPALLDRLRILADR